MARLVWRCLPACLVVVVAGCQRSPGKTEDPALRGTITYKGAPVTGGGLIFLPKDGKEVRIALFPDGKYNVRNLPEGEVLIGVETDSLKQVIDAYEKKAAELTAAMKEKIDAAKAAGVVPPKDPAEWFKGAAGSAPAGKVVAIPKKYADPKTSGLSVTITKTPQKKDFDLTD